jgi:hypothetical protein
MAENVVLLTLPIQRFFDVLGEPLAGGKLYSSVTGTSTPKALYTSAAGTAVHPNPVILDATGGFLGYMLTDEAYRLDLFDAQDVHQPGWPVDGVTGLGSIGGAFVPVLRGSITPGVGTYSAQNGRYQHLGSFVFFTLFLNVLAHTGTGNMTIRGFPILTTTGTAVTVLMFGASIAFPGPVVAYLRETPAMEIEIYTHALATGGIVPIPFALVSSSPSYSIAVSGVYEAL